MKRSLLYVVFLLSVMTLNAQKDFENVSVEILPESELIIAGSTNVNKFDCKFNIDHISKSMIVRFAQQEECYLFNDFKLEFLTIGFDCGNKKMNSDFEDLLVAEHFPEIVILVDKVEFVSAEYLRAFIRVKLAGKENNYQLPIQTEDNRFKGKFKINIRDFNLEPPKKALGLIEVDEMIEIQFDLEISG